MHVLGAGLVAQLEKDLLAMRATRVRLLGWEDHPGEVNDTPLQYSCLENLMDRGAWQATVHGVTRVGHDLAAKLLLLHVCVCVYIYTHTYIHIYTHTYIYTHTCMCMYIYIYTHIYISNFISPFFFVSV